MFSTSLRRELAFRTDLLFQLLAALTGAAAGLAALGAVYAQTASLAGWSAGEAVVLFGTFHVLSGLRAAFVEPNVRWFRAQVAEGKLDDVLLKPVPSILLATLGTCAPIALVPALVGLGVVGLGLRELGRAPSPLAVLGWLALVTDAAVVTWATRVLLASLTFWAPDGTRDVLYDALWQLGRYPVEIHRQPLRFVVTYVLPVAFVATLPAAALTREVSPLTLALGVAAAAVMAAAANLVWRAGLRRYTSATS
ncbi:MAG TPA: ABC-2 family transporter protein [Chloroflexota bacterium]|nr:ABC-2 family transporter protein [Chloroflexota bacterium]